MEFLAFYYLDQVNSTSPSQLDLAQLHSTITRKTPLPILYPSFVPGISLIIAKLLIIIAKEEWNGSSGPGKPTKTEKCGKLKSRAGITPL